MKCHKAPLHQKAVIGDAATKIKKASFKDEN